MWSVPHFAERVRAAVRATGPLCVGIDPSASLLEAWGLPDDASGLRTFALRCVEELEGAVAVVKPQVAFFERHGPAGMAALEAVLRSARDAGLIVVADAKRGDIGSTMEAYADAWLTGPFAADAVTVTPYLGLGALEPAFRAAREVGGGVFVVVTSSNPEGRVVQRAVTAGGAAVEDALVAEIAQRNAAETAGATRAVGSIGAVVGATHGVQGLERLGGLVLAPGLGAQGATVQDVGRAFGGCAEATVLPSTSRGLLSGGPDRLRAAAIELRDELAAALA